MSSPLPAAPPSQPASSSPGFFDLNRTLYFGWPLWQWLIIGGGAALILCCALITCVLCCSRSSAGRPSVRRASSDKRSTRTSGEGSPRTPHPGACEESAATRPRGETTEFAAMAAWNNDIFSDQSTNGRGQPGGASSTWGWAMPANNLKLAAQNGGASSGAGPSGAAGAHGAPEFQRPRAQTMQPVASAPAYARPAAPQIRNCVHHFPSNDDAALPTNGFAAPAANYAAPSANHATAPAIHTEACSPRSAALDGGSSGRARQASTPLPAAMPPPPMGMAPPSQAVALPPPIDGLGSSCGRARQASTPLPSNMPPPPPGMAPPPGGLAMPPPSGLALPPPDLSHARPPPDLSHARPPPDLSEYLNRPVPVGDGMYVGCGGAVFGEGLGDRGDPGELELGAGELANMLTRGRMMSGHI
jgi:hypothetical protein